MNENTQKCLYKLFLRVKNVKNAFLSSSLSWDTANEGPVRIQYKCLVFFLYSQKWNSYFQNRIIMFCLPVPTLIYLWEIYIFPGPVCLVCCREIHVDRSWEYINGSQTHECGNWDWGRAIPRKGIHRWNFPCSGRIVKKLWYFFCFVYSVSIMLPTYEALLLTWFKTVLARKKPKKLRTYIHLRATETQTTL